MQKWGPQYPHNRYDHPDASPTRSGHCCGIPLAKRAGLVPYARRRRVGDLEAPTQRKVKVYSLHSSLRLDMQFRAASRVQRELLLVERPQIARSDAIANLRELDGAFVLNDRPAENRRSLVERKAGRQRSLDFAEGAG